MRIHNEKSVKRIEFALLIFLLSSSLFLLGYLHEGFDALLPQFAPQGIFIVAFILALLVSWIEWQQDIRMDEFKQEFLTIASHKFRTPLTGIKWAAQSLREPVTEEEKQNICKQIDNAGERMIEIVEILSQLGKLESDTDMKPEAVSFREIIEKTIEKYSQKIKEKNLTFSIDIPSAVPLVAVNKIKMQFAIEILVENAIKYTNSGGGVTIRIQKGEREILIEIQDTGIGMTHEEQRHVFHEFYRSAGARTLDTEGMGLGLYISKKIIERNRGKISVSSHGKGKGSTFTIRLKV